MYSGKSTALLSHLRRAEIAGLKVKAFKHALDTRYSSGEIVTHDDTRLNTESVSELPKKKLRGYYDIVGIDEVQFYSLENVTAFINNHYERVGELVVAGLNLDFLGRPFEVVEGLLPYADEIRTCRAVCTHSHYKRICGADAQFTQRLSGHTPVIEAEDVVEVGGSELYSPRCREHFKHAGGYIR